MARFFLLFSMLLLANLAFAQLSSSNLSVTSTDRLILNDTTIINDYLPVVALIKEECRSIIHTHPAFSTDKFSRGDKVLVIQMQGASIDSNNSLSYGTITDFRNAGNFEIATVYDITGNIITLEAALLASFSVEGRVQLVRIPQYGNIGIRSILSCLKWDGVIGGVLVLIADSVIFETDVDVSGKGFRGGVARSAPDVPNYQVVDYMSVENPSFCARKGEGICGFGIEPFISGRGAPANGGGGGNNHNAGGGGGANTSCGGNGGWAYNGNGRYSGDKTMAQGLGGHALQVPVNKVFMGGGGGAGHGNTNQQSQVPASSGGDGGGIVIIIANSLQGNSHSIYARGLASVATEADGAGGGGAGGSVLLAVQSYDSYLHINARGGAGGSVAVEGVGPGGGGGGGAVYVSSPTYPLFVTADVAGGQSGRTKGDVYGATDGCIGLKSNNLIIPENQDTPFTVTGFPDTAICLGQSVQLGVTVSKQGILFYKWTPANTLMYPLSESPIAHPTQTTTYIVTVTDSLNCSVSDTISILVAEQPVITISLPDTTSVPGTQNMLLPVTISLSDIHIASSFDSVHFTIAYRSNVLNVKGVSDGSIINNERKDGYSYISVTVPCRIDPTYKGIFTLTHLVCEILLSEEGETSLDIEQFSFTPFLPCSDIAFLNGGLRTVDYCQGYNIQKFLIPVVSVHPNPMSNTAMITISPHSLPLTVEIINLFGETVKQYSEVEGGSIDDGLQIPLLLPAISTGVYFFRISFINDIHTIPVFIQQ